jgi:hypothetical protein
MHFICTYSQYCSKLSPLPTFLCRFFLSIWQISMRSIIGYVNQQGWPSWKYIVCQRKALYPCFLQWFSIHLVVRLCYSLESLKLSNLNENIYCSTKTIKSISQSWILIGGRFSGLTTPPPLFTDFVVLVFFLWVFFVKRIFDFGDECGPALVVWNNNEFKWNTSRTIYMVSGKDTSINTQSKIKLNNKTQL